MNREPLFDEEVETPSMDLVPVTFPGAIPDKQQIRMYRAELIDRLTGNLGPLKSFILVKLIEKVLSEKEEGLIHQMKDDALEEFKQLFPKDKTAEYFGVTITRKGRSYYEYPANVNAFEVEVNKMVSRLKGMKKAAEIDGTAMKMQVPDSSITVKF